MGGQCASRLRSFCSGVCLGSIGLALLGMSVAAGPQVYVQPYDPSTLGLASQNDTSVGGVGNYATAYDNFTLAGDATITGLTFAGVYFDPGEVGVTTSFQVQFYDDNAGHPGSSLYSSSIPGNGSEVCDSSPNPVCTYSVTVNFGALGGTPYWLSIVSDSEVQPQWAWAGGTGGDGGAFQLYFGQGTAQEGDLAFSLFATQVPEPSSWATMLVGFGAAGTALRRRRTRRPCHA